MMYDLRKGRTGPATGLYRSTRSPPRSRALPPLENKAGDRALSVDFENERLAVEVDCETSDRALSADNPTNGCRSSGKRRQGQRPGFIVMVCVRKQGQRPGFIDRLRSTVREAVMEIAKRQGERPGFIGRHRQSDCVNVAVIVRQGRGRRPGFIGRHPSRSHPRA